MTYKTTQSATGTLVFLLTALAGAVFAAGMGSALVWIVGVILSVVSVLFSSLTNRVDDKAVSWCFGSGLLRKNLPLQELIRPEPVRNKCWYGWGIRLTPHGWLTTSSGLDAVELHLTEGRKVRLGPTEPAQPSRAINEVRDKLRTHLQAHAAQAASSRSWYSRPNARPA